MPVTPLTADEMRTCLALGASVADIRALQADGFLYEEILTFCQTAHDRDHAALTVSADEQAKATKRAMRPENETHPGKSIFSYPEGDVARPREPLVCPTYWVGAPCEHDTSTAQEIELLNRVPAGVYTCEKSDGSKIQVRVTVALDPAGKPERKEFWFPTKDEHRHNQASQVSMLTTMVAQATQVSA